MLYDFPVAAKVSREFRRWNFAHAASHFLKGSKFDYGCNGAMAQWSA
jgi:hypothetical protein